MHRPKESSHSSFSIEAECPYCNSTYRVVGGRTSVLFCPLCGRAADAAHQRLLSSTAPTLSDESTISFIQEHLPHDAAVQFTIGPYQVLRSIGKGGMGEVFLAYDTVCGRRIALKRIRADLIEKEHLQERFLREARITSQLTHPAIIPIYVIHGENNLVYYTMPFVAGDTLKQVVRKTRNQEKNGEALDHIGGSIPALIRIFITICQAVAYAHSKNIIHRDLKPENIILGKYGEVLILDWGLAKLIGSEEPEEAPAEFPKAGVMPEVTRVGKVVGTIPYMAPERALGQPATFQTDIYSLGVILYQLLTLRKPFKRGSLAEFRKTMHKEVLVDPATAAPYRDVPRILSRITEKCLSLDLTERYQSVEQLIHDLENYTEGRSEWYSVGQLSVEEKIDWEFQENVLIAEHTAITRTADEAEWVSMMISKESFSGNTKIEAEITIGEKGMGIGFLMSIPEADERVHLNDGYCLWLGSDINKTTKLLRSSVEVLRAPDIFLKRTQRYRIRIEKVDQTIRFYLDDRLQFSYIGYLPLVGTHVGLLTRDWDFQISPFQLSVGSLSVMVNCLSIPDTFLAFKDYHKALSEYRRIAYSFTGRAEGREALFKAGITLLEQAKESEHKEELLELALEEFERLHGTPGAPLEYLGKALVYQAMKEEEEEIKCYELAYRRYPRHPLLLVLQEQIIARMHEVARYDRTAAYQFILLCVRHLPFSAFGSHTQKLFASLQRHWEPLYFILDRHGESLSERRRDLRLALRMAFWLSKPYIIEEILDDIVKDLGSAWDEVANALFSLLELGCYAVAEKRWESLDKKPDDSTTRMVRVVMECRRGSVEASLDHFLSQAGIRLAPEEFRTLYYLLERALDAEQTGLIHRTMERLKSFEMSIENSLHLNTVQIWAYLWDKKWKEAGELIETYPLELVNKESTVMHVLYGCWLQATEWKEIAQIHFAGVLDEPFPKSWSLLSHYLSGKIYLDTGWGMKAFLWEKRQLYRQLALYYRCTGDESLAKHFQYLQGVQYLNATP